MKYLSLFSGVGGFELGIYKAFQCEAGIQPKGQVDVLRPTGDSADSNSVVRARRRSRPVCIGYSEIDKYAIQTYEKNWGKYEACDEHAHISTQSEQEERTQRGQRPSNELGLQLQPGNGSATLCNRCKGHTNYGSATDIDETKLPDFELLVGGFPCQAFSVAGKRKGFEDTRGTLFFDIARILSHKRPRHLLLENVKGLLSHDSGKTMQTIAKVLADLGYRIEWQVLNAKDFGVPQNRERIFIVGHLRGECAGQVFPISGQGNPNTTNSKSTETAVARTLTGGGHSGGNHSGMTIVKSIAYYNQRTTAAITPYTSTLTARFNGRPDGDGRPALVVPVLTPDRLEKRQNGRRFKEDGEPSFTLNTQDKHGIYDGAKIRRLTPTECERLMSWPDGWTEGVSDTQRYKQCGNGVVSNCVQAVIEKMLECKCLNT